MFIVVVEHDDVGDDVDVAENFDIGVDNLLELVTKFGQEYYTKLRFCSKKLRKIF